MASREPAARGVLDDTTVVDDSASEVVAARLSKAELSDTEPADVRVVGEGEEPSQGAGAEPGPGGAARPGEVGAHPLSSPATPRQGSEPAGAEAAGTSGREEADASVEELLARAGFIQRAGPFTYVIGQGARKGGRGAGCKQGCDGTCALCSLRPPMRGCKSTPVLPASPRHSMPPHCIAPLGPSQATARACAPPPSFMPPPSCCAWWWRR